MSQFKADDVKAPSTMTMYIDDTITEPEPPPKPTKAQKRAMAKEAKRLENIEDKKLILRDSLRRELELSKRMDQRGTDEWHEMCREIKITELRQEMVLWGENAQRNIERKNEMIQMLISDVEQTQEQHTRAFGKTVELIDHIRECFHTMIDGIKQLYEEQAEEMLRNFHKEIKRRSEEVDFIHQNSDNIILASNIITRDQLNKDYSIYLEKRDDRINTEIENRFRVRNQVAGRMNEMHQQLTEFVDCLQNTELDAQKYERIRWLSERQMLFVEESRRLRLEEMKFVSKNAELQREIVRIETENAATINDLRMEYQYFNSVLKGITKQMKLGRQDTHEKLRIVTSESYDIIKKFEKIVKRGELLLNLSINCRKLQTQSEKVILGGEIVPKQSDDDDDDNDNFKILTLDLEKHLDMTEEEFIELNKKMRNFWRRQAMVQTQNLMLLDEKNQLKSENEKYIDFIKNMTGQASEKDLLETIKVEECKDQPVQLLYDTKCLSYKSRRKKPQKSKTTSELLDMILDK